MGQSSGLPPGDRQAWLEDVHKRAEALIAKPDFERRFEAFLRPEQRGRWRLDGITMNEVGRFWSKLTCAKPQTGKKYHYTGFGVAMV
jgi:hypothetical protein